MPDGENVLADEVALVLEPTDFLVTVRFLEVRPKDAELERQKTSSKAQKREH